MPLTTPRQVILDEIKHQSLLHLLKPPANKGDPSSGQYYDYHGRWGHDMEDCCDLQNQIENLIQQGELQSYV